MKRLISSQLPGAADVLHPFATRSTWIQARRAEAVCSEPKDQGAIYAEQTQYPLDTGALTRSELDARRAVGIPYRLHHLGGAATVPGADILSVEPTAGRRTARGWPGAHGRPRTDHCPAES